MSNKFVPLEKRTKKQQKAYNNLNRMTNGQNTGTRNMDEGKVREFAKQDKKLSKKEIDKELSKRQRAYRDFGIDGTDKATVARITRLKP